MFGHWCQHWREFLPLSSTSNPSKREVQVHARAWREEHRSKVVHLQHQRSESNLPKGPPCCSPLSPPHCPSLWTLPCPPPRRHVPSPAPVWSALVPSPPPWRGQPPCTTPWSAARCHAPTPGGRPPVGLPGQSCRSPWKLFLEELRNLRGACGRHLGLLQQAPLVKQPSIGRFFPLWRSNVWWLWVGGWSMWGKGAFQLPFCWFGGKEWEWEWEMREERVVCWFSVDGIFWLLVFVVVGNGGGGGRGYI